MRWIVDEVTARAVGVQRQYAHGFNILDGAGMGPRLLVSLAYKTPEEAEKARELVQRAIADAIEVA